MAEVDQSSKQFSKGQIEQLRKTLRENYERRFRRPRETKYGTINKGFTEMELQHFLRNVKNDKFRLLFKFQAFLGLRIGEVTKLHISNIDFEKRELTIMSEKSRKLDSLLIPADLFRETIEFINKNTNQIKAANGHIFFKENDNNHNRQPYIEQNYVRKVFRETAQKAGLNTVYGYSEESYPNKKERALHRLTTHSLRHYAVTKFAKSTNGNVVLTSRFARHCKPETTMRYIAKDKDELYKSIDYAFLTQ